jgi:hypothetical protein
MSEGRELAAFKKAIEEIGDAGWTTCQLFILQRVRELLMADSQLPCKVLKTEFIGKSPKYDMHQCE